MGDIPQEKYDCKSADANDDNVNNEDFNDETALLSECGGSEVARTKEMNVEEDDRHSDVIICKIEIKDSDANASENVEVNDDNEDRETMPVVSDNHKDNIIPKQEENNDIVVDVSDNDTCENDETNGKDTDKNVLPFDTSSNNDIPKEKDDDDDLSIFEGFIDYFFNYNKDRSDNDINNE